MKVERLNSRFAARVTGIDFRAPVPEDTKSELRDLLWREGVVVFPGQVLTREEQLEFMGFFAPPAPQPVRKFLGGSDDHALTVLDPKYVVSGDETLPVDGAGRIIRFPEFAGWHSDSTFSPEINAAATLRAEITPPVGGDTCFASMRAAYDDLSPLMQEWLEGCEAIHCYPPDFKSAFKFHLYGDDAERRFDEKYIPWRHPVVVRHPETGDKSLFVNPVYTTEIAGLSEKESRELLSFLFRHCTSAEYVYRHHWTPNDLVIWDELMMIHRAPEDFAPHPRRMIRITGGTLVPPAANEHRSRRELHGRVVRLPAGRPAATG
jgi:taurine dioxygenase